jgi:UDP-N-acetylmuramate--alanine ligase
MAGIAEILCNLGYRVSGSDIRANQLTEHLLALGCEVYIGHGVENVAPSVTAVVRSSAIALDNPEITAAKSNGIPIISRAEMLAELMRMKYGIAIAGSHGKTTTTSMTARILSEMGLDPTVVVGGRVLNQATGAKLGAGQYFIAEADESDGSFCLLKPAIAVVTNIDHEHMSHYGSFEVLKDSFREFISQIPFYGLVIACIDDPVVAEIIAETDKRVLTYGLSEKADVRARDLICEGPNTRFILSVNACDVAQVCLPLAGKHMVSNALAAIGVGLETGAFPEEAAEALAQFPGVSRRTERIGIENGVLVLDDYGHHPTEIRATISAIRENFLSHHCREIGAGELGRLIVLFEPHRFTRTKEVFDEFRTAFEDSDKVYLSPIYSAGEAPIEGISAQSLSKSIQNCDAIYVDDFAANLDSILDDLRPGDIVLTLGAGAVGRVGKEVCQNLKLRANK